MNPGVADRGFLPASTFRIANTLVALETGVVSGEDFALPWDGKHRDIEEWNRDHDLTSAMRNSVVWFFQEIARRVGEERMKRELALFRYGNADIGGGIDHFWLGGALRISAREQVHFLRRLHAGVLPVTADHAALVRRILASETADSVTMRWKTGLTNDDKSAVAWMVGYVERADKTFVFACVMTARPRASASSPRCASAFRAKSSAAST